jgi:pimeloyl-ACP methyl ester carboxylesterase
MENPDRGSRGGVHADRSIDEGMFVPINGVDQWVTIRGGDGGNPALLLLGGGGSRMTPFFAPWEKDFTVIQWDPPGAGATQGLNGDAGTGPLTLNRIARDAIAVAEFVRQRLNVNKIAVVGVSGGTIIGLKMVKQRPDLFAAYVGTGQFVNWARQDALSYAMILEQARAAGDQPAVAELEQIGAPPYKDAATDAIKSKYAGAFTPAEKAAFASLAPGVMADIKAPPRDARYVPKGVELEDVRARAMATYEKLRGEMLAFDARRLGLEFGVPMFFFQGERDAYSVTSEVRAYEAEIRAPKKMLVLVEGGGHSCIFMRDGFLRLLNSHVRPVAVAGGQPVR